MKRFVAWDGRSIDNLPKNISRVFTELDEAGHVTREIGVDASGTVIYRAPRRVENRLERGLFDGALVDLQSDNATCTREEFERMWQGH